MSVTDRPEAETKAARHLIEALIGFAAFCAISFLSFSVPLALPLMVISGIAVPLVWGRMARNWEFMGFTRRNLASAIRWGLAAGAATSLIGFRVLQERSLPTDLARPLAPG